MSGYGQRAKTRGTTILDFCLTSPILYYHGEQLEHLSSHSINKIHDAESLLYTVAVESYSDLASFTNFN